MTAQVEFPNLQSRLLLKPWFDRQFIIPETPPKPLGAFLRWYENHVLNVDVEGIEIDRPIFLISLPRAGSSMLQNILCTHPDVAYISHGIHMFRETFCASEDLRRRLSLNARGQRYLGDSVDVDAESPCDPIMFWSDWLQVPLDDTGYRELHLTDFSSTHIERVRETIQRILWCYGGASKRFLTKFPGLLPYLDLLAELFPDAKFIHLVRDPRSAANSMLKLYQNDKAQFEKLKAEHPKKVNISSPFIAYPRLPHLTEYLERYGADDIRTTAHLYQDAVDFVSEKKDRLPSFYEIKYEDLLSEPQRRVAEIFDFCGLQQPDVSNEAFHTLMSKVGIIHHKNRYGSFEVIEEICANAMQRYGYA